MRNFTFSMRAWRATSLFGAILGCSLSLGLMQSAHAGFKTITIPNSTATALISDHLVSLEQYEKTNYQLPANTLVYADNNSFVYFKLVDKTAATQFLEQLPAIAQGFKYSVKPRDFDTSVEVPNAYVNYFNRSSLVGTVDSTVYRSLMSELELHKPRNQLLLDVHVLVPSSSATMMQDGAENAESESTVVQEVTPTQQEVSTTTAPEQVTSSIQPASTTPLVGNCDLPVVDQTSNVDATLTTNLTLSSANTAETSEVVAGTAGEAEQDCLVNGQAIVPVAPPADAPQGTQAAVSKYPPVQPALPVQPTPLPNNEQLGASSGMTKQPALTPALPVQPTPIPSNEQLYSDVERDAEFAQLQEEFRNYNPATSLTLLSATGQQRYATYLQHLQALTASTQEQTTVAIDATAPAVAQDSSAGQAQGMSTQESVADNQESLQVAGQDAETIEQRPVDLAPQPQLSEQALQYLGSRDYREPQFNQTLFDVWLNPTMRTALETDIFATQLVRLQNFTTPEYRLVTVNGTPALRMDTHVLNITREYRGKYQFQHAVIMDYSPTQYLVGVYYYYGDQVEARDVTFGAELFLNSISTGK